MNTMEEVCKFIGSRIIKNPTCVETGTTYVTIPNDRVHTSTNNIAEHICRPNNGVLHSFDFDEEHQDRGREVCGEFAEHVNFILGDSVENLAIFALTNPVVDFLLLDSKDYDIRHMVNEFEAISACLRPDKHFVCVDDIHNPHSNKWFMMVPLLKTMGYKYIEAKTIAGLFIAYKGYDLD